MLVILTGPTGSGKTSVALATQHRHGWNLIKTLTTRPPRPCSTPDTKEHVTRAAMAKLLSDPAQFREFRYEGHEYATPLLETQSAARSLEHVSIIDWVHPHPEDLTFLGEHVLAVVLLPTPTVLERRLHKANRRDRITRALTERQQIVSSLDSYRPPWIVYEGDATVEQLAEFLNALVRGHPST